MSYNSFLKMSAWECRFRGLWGGLSHLVMGGSPVSAHFVSREIDRMKGTRRSTDSKISTSYSHFGSLWMRYAAVSPARPEPITITRFFRRGLAAMANL